MKRDFSQRFGFLVNDVAKLYGEQFDRLARELTAQASDAPEECSTDLLRLARYAQQVLRFVSDQPSGPAAAMAAE